MRRGGRVARSFGRIVSEGRVAAGMTQAELAERLDVSQSTIHNWERRKPPGWMHPDMIRDLARLVGADASEIAESLGYPVKARTGRTAVVAAAPDESTLIPALSDLIQRILGSQQEAFVGWMRDHYGTAAAEGVRDSLTRARRSA